MFAKIILALVTATIISSGCATTRNQDKMDEASQASPYLKMILARMAEDDGDFETALKYYNDLNNPYAWLNIARIYVANSDDANALAYLNRVLDSGQYVNDSIELIVNIYVKSNNIDKALSDVEGFSKKYPQDSKIKLLLAKLKLYTSDPKGAKALLEQIPQDNEDIELQYMVSKTCLELKDTDCAIRSLERVIEIAPDFPQPYIDLGRIYESEGLPDEAISVYSKLLESDPESREARIALADLYIINGDNKEAIGQLKELLQLFPNRDVSRKLIILEIDTGMFEDAIDLLRSLKDPTAEDKYFLAIAYSGNKEFTNALDMLEQIKTDEQLECDASVLKSSILEEMGKHQEAYETLKGMWERQSKEKPCREAGYRLATLLEEKGQTEEGIKIAQAILEDNPKDPIMLNFVGYLWADKGINLDKAKKMISDALSSRPDDGYVLDSMAWVLFKTGRAQEALIYMEKALNVFPDEPLINEHMGDIQLKLGNKSLALKYFLKAKQKSKKSPSPQLEKKISDLVKKPRKSGR